ncbi:hypothetical protein M5X02_24510, partial [Paenibacillus alvei]
IKKQVGGGMEGWIKLHRKTLENPVVCKDSDYIAVWMYLLLNATHKEYQTMFSGERITLQPGQLITGRKTIAEKFNIHESKVQRILKSFEIEQQIEQQNSNKNRLISILSWSEYQGSEQQIEQQVNNNRTTTEQQVNTNKNVKNKENEKNDEKDSRPDSIETILGLNVKQDAIPNNSDADSERKISVQEYRSQITAKYLQRRGKGLVISNTDEEEIDKYISDRIPLRTVLSGIDQSFDTFKPKHGRDEIRSLKRCSPIIFDLHAKQGTVPTAEASGSVPEADTVPPEEKGNDNVIDLLEQLKRMRGDTG